MPRSQTPDNVEYSTIQNLIYSCKNSGSTSFENGYHKIAGRLFSQNELGLNHCILCWYQAAWITPFGFESLILEKVQVFFKPIGPQSIHTSGSFVNLNTFKAAYILQMSCTLVSKSKFRFILEVGYKFLLALLVWPPAHHKNVECFRYPGVPRGSARDHVSFRDLSTKPSINLYM